MITLHPMKHEHMLPVWAIMQDYDAAMFSAPARYPTESLEAMSSWWNDVAVGPVVGMNEAKQIIGVGFMDNRSGPAANVNIIKRRGFVDLTFKRTVRRALRYWKEQFGVSMFYATIRDDNKPAKDLARESGFKFLSSVDNGAIVLESWFREVE